MAEARMLYPGHVTARGENGGVYAVTTTNGTIRGYLSLEISNPPNKIKVVSIAAGVRRLPRCFTRLKATHTRPWALA